MVNQVILSGLDGRRCAEVHAVFLAGLLDVLVGARQSEDGGVELGEVFLQNGGCITRGIAGNHDGENSLAALFLDLLVHERHLVELIGANIGAVREAEVYLGIR